MQLAENYYRNYENMLLSDTKAGVVSRFSGLDGREIAMANNAMWALTFGRGEQGETATNRDGEQKMVVINHIIHTKTSTQYQGSTWGHLVPMGQLMKQMLNSRGEAMFNICMLYGGGTFWNGWQTPRERFVDTAPPPSQDGLESVMKDISVISGVPDFFLHWELAPKEAWPYLNEVVLVRENDYSIRASPSEWNGCIYLDRVSHATPA